MPLSRRQFNALAGAAGLSTVGTKVGTKVLAGDTTQKTLRVIAYNAFGGVGWPKNRTLTETAVSKGQMPKRLASELALHEPDIVTFSESPSEEFAKQVAELLGMKFVRFPSGGKWPGTLLSRFEIVESMNVPLADARPQKLFTRHWGRAVIKLPNGEPLVIHSAHLFPTGDSSIRLQEIRAMLLTMKPDLDRGRSMLVMGDFNHGPDTAEYKLWTGAGWVDTFAKVGKGNGFTIRSDIPKWRIDYVMAAGPIAERIIESRPLFVGAFRLHIADNKSFALSDHLPQLAVFQLTQ